MPVALKACWSVTAGLIPEDPMHEYSKGWGYSSKDYEADGNVRGATYARCNEEAHKYASSLAQGGFNWVRVEYLWL